MEEFLLRIKSISNSLNSIGDTVSFKEQLAVVLGGVPPEYESFVNCDYGKCHDEVPGYEL